MNRIFLVGLVVAVLIVSCHNKTPVIAARTEHPPAPAKPVATPAPAVTAPAESASSEALIAGQKIYTGSCARCHDPKPVDNWTVDQWKPILKSMVRKSKLDSIQIAQVTAYVNANAKKI